jgi:tubby-related protein 1
MDSNTEIVGVLYESNVFGMQGPRKLTCRLPFLDTPMKPAQSLMNEKDILSLKNKMPIWNGTTQAFVLDFGGRVLAASVKNFQIVSEHDPDYICLQFGKGIISCIHKKSQ